MTAPTPQPNYYDTGRSRRAFLIGAGAAVLVGGAGLVVWGSGVLAGDDDAGSTGAAGGGAASGGNDSSGEQATRVIREGTSNGEPGTALGFASMAMVGDSITEGSASSLQTVLTNNGYTDVDIQGKASRRIEIGDGNSAPLSGIKTMFGMLADGVRPEAWVIALGTNDVGQYANAEDYTRLIDAMVTMLPDDEPLVWVDVYRPEYLDDSQLFNQLLRQRLGDRGNAVVADWYSRASDPDLGILRKDGIHPNDRGTLVFAALVADALAQLANG